LNLKPEALGNVKIRLEMTENKIAGHIIVESDEALRAFEQEIRALEQSFLDSGFDGASLEMAVAPDAGQGGPGQRGREGDTGPFVSEQLVASAYDSPVSGLPEAVDDGFRWLGNGPDGQGRPQVNMLV
jgi:hypothetical protein